MEFKTTLLMPVTNFEMRGNLINKEPLLVKKWQDEKLYERLLANRAGKEPFVLHDGPPYANGNIHCGHMLNRLLKDFVVRYKSMQGYYTPFVLGWDTHGLPIENQVTKSGVNRKTTPIVDFRKKCEEYALKQVNNQKEQIRRLGVVGDFDHPYLTLSKDYEARQIEVFKDMALKGYIFKGLKPVYWSPSSESALAESEIEYYDVESYSIYVAFKIKDAKNKIQEDASFIIWTTTPWTIPANLAICLNKSYTYGLFKTDLGNFIFLNEFKDALSKELGFKQCELIRTYQGEELEGIITKHPLYDRDSVIILGDHVTNDAGTGCVHTAPGHGLDDYIVGSKYGLKPYCPVDSRGYLDETTGPFNHLFYEDANPKVIEALTNAKALLKASKFKHSYPHDWRTKKPLIFRATPQWFCSIKPVKEKLLAEIEKITWYPSWGKTRMRNMITEREDWCISRQRAWGVPLPIIYCEDKTPIMEAKVFDHIIKLIKENGSNIWYLKAAKDLLPPGYKNEHSPHGEFTKETDIMDVWFDSGSSWNGTLKERDIKYPADLYLEGNDQYRGWFNSSLIISTIVTGEAAFKTCVTHGFVVDEKWEKMSKSKGNGIDPSKVANQYGADILRLWAATVDFKEDARISEAIIKQTSDMYRKIRNTFKYLLGNLVDGSLDHPFNPEKDHAVSFTAHDTYYLAMLEHLKNEVIRLYDSYNFNQALSLMNYFFVVVLSQNYLNYAKDILYCEAKDSVRRRQVQTVLYEMTFTLMRLLTPILPFTMEEVNNNLPYHSKNNPNLYDFPKHTEVFTKDGKLLNLVGKLNNFLNDVYRALEDLRKQGVIGSSQEASLNLTVTDPEIYQALSQVEPAELARLFIVSKAQISYGDKQVISATRAKGEKCPRCWNYHEDLVTLKDGTKVCKRCAGVLKHDHQI
ncbi:MAG: isoleucine--tRNA ligase [Bacilli bacterium]|nr:isoleucine--tRNA ligase [Bacilli bacterium]